jgi:hypothetical protein
MKENLFDDIISTDVSEEVDNLLSGIYNIHDLKLYLEVNNDEFKKVKIYQIESDIKYVKSYLQMNKILVTTGFFKAKEEDKIDVCKKILEQADLIDEVKLIDDNVVAYSELDKYERIKDILNNSTIARSYKYNIGRLIEYYEEDYNNDIHDMDLSEIICIDVWGSSSQDYFVLMNDDMFINLIMNTMSKYSMSLPKTTEGKLRKAITKINEKNKD